MQRLSLNFVSIYLAFVWPSAPAYSQPAADVCLSREFVQSIGVQDFWKVTQVSQNGLSNGRIKCSIQAQPSKCVYHSWQRLNGLRGSFKGGNFEIIAFENMIRTMHQFANGLPSFATYTVNDDRSFSDIIGVEFTGIEKVMNFLHLACAVGNAQDDEVLNLIRPALDAEAKMLEAQCADVEAVLSPDRFPFCRR